MEALHSGRDSGSVIRQELTADTSERLRQLLIPAYFTRHSMLDHLPKRSYCVVVVVLHGNELFPFSD